MRIANLFVEAWAGRMMRVEEITETEVVQNRRRGLNKVFKIFKVIAISSALLITVALAAVPPIMIGDIVNLHVDFNTIYTPEEFGIKVEKLYFETDDNVKIVGYESYVPESKAVVIFISGIHNPSVTSFFGHAKLLSENGYSSILYETRAHGESEGKVIGLGYKEVLDTKAVVDYIKGSEKYKDVPIVVWGMSMGGTIAINSIGQLNEIDGLISMSAYSSWEDAFSDNILMMGAPKVYAVAQKPFVKLYTLFKYGFSSYDLSPKKQIEKLGERPALLIHSTKDSQVPFKSFERIVKNAPHHIEKWEIEGDKHMILEEEFLAPWENKEYCNRILSFLDKYFDE